MDPRANLNLKLGSSTSAFMTPPTTPHSSGGGGCGNPTSTTPTNSSSSTSNSKKGRTTSGESTGSGPRLIVDFSDLTVPCPTTPRTVQPEEFRRLFLVSLEKMMTLEPESLPFRQPVDPQALGIPDYNDIIRKPMDLQTIRIKMNCLKYTDPWLFVDDVLLMFDNAWVYNRPASKVFQYCEKLSQVFQQEINPVMTRLGYRHGRIHQFNSQTLSCFGRPVCLIPRNATYYNFLRFHLCEKCYSANMEEDGVKLPWQNNVTVDKENFIQLHNDSENSYSPAAEMHRAYQRDAQMSRQLVIREFLKLLSSSTIHPDKKKNVRKMLRLNGQLRSEFIQYFSQEADAYLLTPTEVERIKQQLRVIEDGEENLEKVGESKKNPESTEISIKSAKSGESANSNETKKPDILIQLGGPEEEQVEGQGQGHGGDLDVDLDHDHDPNTSSSNSHSHLAGVELESSSGSNSSTLSSLKSLN